MVGIIRILGGLIGQLNRNPRCHFRPSHWRWSPGTRRWRARRHCSLPSPGNPVESWPPRRKGAVRNHSGRQWWRVLLLRLRRLHICCHVVLAVALVQLDGILLIAARKGTAPDLHRGTLMPQRFQLIPYFRGPSSPALKVQPLITRDWQLGKYINEEFVLSPAVLPVKVQSVRVQVQSGGLGRVCTLVRANCPSLNSVLLIVRYTSLPSRASPFTASL